MRATKVPRRALAIPLALCALVVWLAVADGSSARVGAPAVERSSSSSLVWVLYRTVVNPRDEAPPAESNVVTRPGHLDWQILEPPQVAFAIDYPVPKTLTPGKQFKLPVTLSGRITGGMDTHRYRHLDAILYMNDRWVGNGPTLSQSCVIPAPGAKPVCDPPGTAKGFLTFDVPTPTDTEEEFNFGVGALNCGSACGVRLMYESRPANDIGRAELVYSASVKAEATSGSSTLFPSYVQSRVVGSGRIRVSPDGAVGTFVVSHQFALDVFPDYKTTLAVTAVSDGADTPRDRVTSTTLRARVRNSTYSGCRPGSIARITLTDVRSGGKGRDAVRIQLCGDTLTYRDRSPDASDRVIVTIRRP